jgi:putative membrane protein
MMESRMLASNCGVARALLVQRDDCLQSAVETETMKWTPYCGAAPVPADLLGNWNLDPVLLAGLSAAALLWWPRRHADRRGSRAFAWAWLVAVILFVSPLCAATSALFTFRTVHHLAVTTVLAPLLALALGRARMLPGSLALWTLLHAIAVWAWHAPSLYGQALSNDLLYWVMQASLLGSAVGFWSAVRRAEAIAGVAALLATMVQMGLLGALLTFGGTPLYVPHFATTSAWGLTPLADQQLSGLIMWAPGAGLYLLAAGFILARWLGDEREPAAA